MKKVQGGWLAIFKEWIHAILNGGVNGKNISKVREMVGEIKMEKTERE